MMAGVDQQLSIGYMCATNILLEMDPSLRIVLARRCPALPRLPKMKLRIKQMHFGPNSFKIGDFNFTLSVKKSHKTCIGSDDSEELPYLVLTVDNEATNTVIWQEVIEQTASLENAFKYLLKKALKDTTTIDTVTLLRNIQAQHLGLLEEIIPYPLKSIEFELYQNDFYRKPIFAKAEKAVQLLEDAWFNRISRDEPDHPRVHYESFVNDAIDFGSHLTYAAPQIIRKHFTIKIRDLEQAKKCLTQLSTCERFVAGIIEETRETSFEVCYTGRMASNGEQECNVYVTETRETLRNGEEKVTYLLNAVLNPIGYAFPFVH